MQTDKLSHQKALPPVRLRVTAAAEARLRAGHPWLFADSIREQNRAGGLGDLAVIYDRRDRFLAVGLFDPESPIRLRALHAGKPETINGQWWAGRLAQALERREGLFDEQTTGYRWINGESDGWPGLVLDRYETTLVLKLYTAAWLPRLEEVVALINQSLRPARIVLRLSRNIQPTAESQFQRPDGEIVLGESLTGPVIFQESGLRFEADVLRGQKTGFFLDQRENRRMVETVCSPPFRVLPSTAHGKVWTTNGEHPKGWATNGREVLNVFSFTGGFSVYAARGGARSVTDLDISAHALAGAKRNHALNQSHPAIAACRHEVIKGDASEWLAQNPKRRFDLVILDPPSLARRETERAGAIRAYARLASLGIEHLSGNGVLVACSCSAHVSAQEFFGAVRKSVSGSGRKFVELGTTGHAPDHPAAFKEAEYLKAIYLVTSPVD